MSVSFNREHELSLVSYALKNPKAIKNYKSLQDAHFTYSNARTLWKTLLTLVPENEWKAPTELELKDYIARKADKGCVSEAEGLREDIERIFSINTTGVTGKHLHELYLNAEKAALAKRIAEISLEDFVKEYPKLKAKLEKITEDRKDTEEVCFSLFSKTGIEKSVKMVREQQDGSSTIATGWPLLDIILGGGLRKGELTCFLGPTGTGKSLCLFNLATNVYHSGRRVIYIVMDNTLAEFSERLHAVTCGISIPKRGEEALGLEAYTRAVYDALPDQKPNDRFLLKVWPPKRKKASELKFCLEQIKEYCYEADKAAGLPQYALDDLGINGNPIEGARELWGQIDLLCVDYGDLFAPERAGDQTHIALAASFEEMVAISREFDIPVVTATQTSKVGAQAENIQLGHVSNSWDSLMAIANIIGLAQTLGEKLRNEMRWEFLKMRRLEATGKYIKMQIIPQFQKIIQEPDFFEPLPITKDFRSNEKLTEEQRLARIGEERSMIELAETWDARSNDINPTSIKEQRIKLREGIELVRQLGEF